MKNFHVVMNALALLFAYSVSAKTPDFADCHVEDNFHDQTLDERADFQDGKVEVSGKSSNFNYTFKIQSAEETKSGNHYRGYIEAADGRNEATAMSSDISGDQFTLIMGYKGTYDRNVICKVYWK